MKRFSLSSGLSSSLLCLCLGSLLPGACATEQNTLEPEEETGGTKPTTTAGKSNGGSAGKPGAFGGTGAGKPGAGGEGNMGGEPSSDDGGEGPAPQGGMGGTTAPTDKCQTSSQCTQAEGSCFVCESTGKIKDCVDKGAPECDNGTLEPCELCETDDEKDCLTLGTPGEFSGGTATCNGTCDGWDTSTCSVCGNDVKEDGEDCDGADPAGPHTCDDEGIVENPDTELDCSNDCKYDTTVCSGCSKGVGSCLDGSNCVGAACSGAECKLDTTCALNCGGGGIACDDVQCNHDATCSFACNNSGHCTHAVCDTFAACTFDCHGGGSTCNGTVCKSGSTCAFTCNQSGQCKDVACQPGADCDFNCNDGGSVCSGNAVCGAGKTCVFDCNNSGNCKDLAVTCEADSTCTFNCTGGGSQCPKATCEADSTCNFSCGNSGNCNAPTCANGACTGNQ